MDYMMLIVIIFIVFPQEMSLFGVSWLFKDKEVSENIKTKYRIQGLCIIIFCIFWYVKVLLF